MSGCNRQVSNVFGSSCKVSSKMFGSNYNISIMLGFCKGSNMCTSPSHYTCKVSPALGFLSVTVANNK
jgi:hypothetical protein